MDFLLQLLQIIMISFSLGIIFYEIDMAIEVWYQDKQDKKNYPHIIPNLPILYLSEH
jgi:hypothetical protein